MPVTALRLLPVAFRCHCNCNSVSAAAQGAGTEAGRCNPHCIGSSQGTRGLALFCASHRSRVAHLPGAAWSSTGCGRNDAQASRGMPQGGPQCESVAGSLTTFAIHTRVFTATDMWQPTLDSPVAAGCLWAHRRGCARTKPPWVSSPPSNTPACVESPAMFSHAERRHYAA
ncbi:hypothetical protein BT67DRAFT_123750 [Trichocladium antarcticum]|uniref:Uncharacterized protein n=1 Tax=Trichocladium antarcticum TaxID=1450529 RepID=A0AAN6US29_9PEZI|nr:hypothetical protein BT67DRAFT_123750 [Trichocladium antarcticum]